MRPRPGTGAPPAAALAALSGRPGGPVPELPAGLLPGLARLAGIIADRSGALGRPVVVDPVAVVCERAAAAGLTRQGDVSCGGACRLLPAADGWVAVSLPRPDDWSLTAAWLERPTPLEDGRWDRVAEGVARLEAAELVARAGLLGLAVASVGERAPDRRGTPVDDAAPPDHLPGVTVRDAGPGRAPMPGRPVTVVDLSSLWAGPLAASLLLRAGAQVVKVESTTRPDGARRGPRPFFASLNGGKVPVSLDLGAAPGRRALADLVARADVVVTSARPRALEQLGLDPWALVGAGGPGVWLAVTGYGDGPGSAERVAFGDDAAAAGGLVVRDVAGPNFCGDALADPVTGLAGAAAVLEVLAAGRRAVVVASMADVAGGLV